MVERADSVVFLFVFRFVCSSFSPCHSPRGARGEEEEDARVLWCALTLSVKCMVRGLEMSEGIRPKRQRKSRMLPFHFFFPLFQNDPSPLSLSLAPARSMSPKAATIAAGTAASETVVTLKAFLSDRGLAVDGLKADLVERVEAALAVRFWREGREGVGPRDGRPLPC